LASFRARYGVATNVPILGPWLGALDNAGEMIQLLAPDKPDVTSSNITVPYVVVDRIDYQPSAPWPTNADGMGSSLQRLVPGAYGNDPTNWVAAEPTAGRLNALAACPTLTASSPPGGPVTISVLATPGLSYELEYKTNLADLVWTPIPPLVPAGSSLRLLTDTNAPAQQRFYRIRAE
jgi:hypothetical protein